MVAILGSTMDGSYEPVLEISQALDRLQAERGCDIPIHVDGASGGFVAPFLQPDLEWDFRVPRVASINSSGHKYGLVYPGVGWVMWRTPDALPDDLVFKVNYLGGEMPTFALNFSRPGAQVAAQYYNFIRLGWQGYRHVQQTSQDIALYLSGEIAKMGPFELLTDGSDLPVFAFKLRDDVTAYSVFDLSERLRQRGWQVPAYTFPENMTDTAVMRIVVRNGFSLDLAGLLLDDLRRQVKILDLHPQTQPPAVAPHQRRGLRALSVPSSVPAGPGSRLRPGWSVGGAVAVGVAVMVLCVGVRACRRGRSCCRRGRGRAAGGGGRGVRAAGGRRWSGRRRGRGRGRGR